MLAPLLAHHVPSEFPLWTAVGGQTACLDGQTAPATEASGLAIRLPLE
jgi:hypothetical protein